MLKVNQNHAMKITLSFPMFLVIIICLQAMFGDWLVSLQRREEITQQCNKEVNVYITLTVL